MPRRRRSPASGRRPGVSSQQTTARTSEVKAPFRFARINRWIHEPAWADLVSHDVPFADGLSGEAEVEITAESSILVGGDRRKANADEEGEVRPFQLPDGRYAIPGSALQGMARAILEIAGFGRLGPWVADRKFGIRDLSGTPTAREHYQNRLSTNNRDHVTIHSKAGWLMKSANGAPCILPCKYARIHLDDVLKLKGELHRRAGLSPPSDGVLRRRSDAKARYQWFMHGLPNGMAALDACFDIEKPRGYRHNNRRITITYSRCVHATTGGGTRGTLVLTGKPQNGAGPGHKKLEFVFHRPDRSTARSTGTSGALPVDHGAWETFRLLHEEQPGRDANPNWDFWRSEFDRGRPIPVFYWHEGGRVTTLGTAFAFKAAHKKSARDLLGHSHAGHLDPIETMRLDLAHLLFGVAAEHDGGRGLKRRARFSLACADSSPQPPAPAYPSVLLGPKPSYVGLYVRQNGHDGKVAHGEPMASYTPLNRPNHTHLHRPELSGVKIWPTRDAGRFAPGPVPRDLAGNRRVQTNLVTLPPGTVFRSRLTFHNLRPVELGALLWTLSFGDAAAFGDGPNGVTRRHRLGMGKPLGLGEVTIRVTGLQTEAACPTSDLAAIRRSAADLVRSFEAHMKSDSVYGPEWSESKQVKALLEAATPSPPTASVLEYMTLEEYQSARRNAEYLPDYAPSGSHEKPFPVAGPTVRVNPGQPAPANCPWVDETIAALMSRIHERDASKILRGRPLAEAWRAIDDPALKREALQDIKSRWRDSGWWDNPPGKAAQRAKKIYEEGGESLVDGIGDHP